MKREGAVGTRTIAFAHTSCIRLFEVKGIIALRPWLAFLHFIDSLNYDNQGLAALPGTTLSNSQLYYTTRTMIRPYNRSSRAWSGSSLL